MGCSAMNCKNREPNFKMKRFPADPKICKIWVHNCGRKNFTPTPSSRICEVNFLDYYFQKGWKFVLINIILHPTYRFILKIANSKREEKAKRSLKKMPFPHYLMCRTPRRSLKVVAGNPYTKLVSKCWFLTEEMSSIIIMFVFLEGTRKFERQYVGNPEGNPWKSLSDK